MSGSTHTQHTAPPKKPGCSSSSLLPPTSRQLAPLIPPNSSPHSYRKPQLSFFLTPAWAKALVPLVGGGGMSVALPPWRRRPGFAGVWMVLLCLLRTRRRRSALCYPSYPRGFRLVPAFFSFRLGVWLSSGGGEVVATQRMWCFAPSCLSCQPAMSIRLYGEHSAFRRCGALQARARR